MAYRTDVDAAARRKIPASARNRTPVVQPFVEIPIL
jgi:hypothetical protein